MGARPSLATTALPPDPTSSIFPTAGSKRSPTPSTATAATRPRSLTKAKQPTHQPQLQLHTSQLQPRWFTSQLQSFTSQLQSFTSPPQHLPQPPRLPQLKPPQQKLHQLLRRRRKRLKSNVNNDDDEYRGRKASVLPLPPPFSILRC